MIEDICHCRLAQHRQEIQSILEQLRNAPEGIQLVQLVGHRGPLSMLIGEPDIGSDLQSVLLHDFTQLLEAHLWRTTMALERRLSACGGQSPVSEGYEE